MNAPQKNTPDFFPLKEAVFLGNVELPAWVAYRLAEGQDGEADAGATPERDEDEGPLISIRVTTNGKMSCWPRMSGATLQTSSGFASLPEHPARRQDRSDPLPEAPHDVGIDGP
jgi:hypothetical protein